jgi:hypothetical protein
MTEKFSSETDWFPETDTDYINTYLSTPIEIPGKTMNFGSLGMRKRGYEKKVNEFGDQIEEFDIGYPSQDADDINIAMPEADSSDEEDEQPIQDSVSPQKEIEKPLKPVFKEAIEPEPEKHKSSTMSVRTFLKLTFWSLTLDLVHGNVQKQAEIGGNCSWRKWFPRSTCQPCQEEES